MRMNCRKTTTKTIRQSNGKYTEKSSYNLIKYGNRRKQTIQQMLFCVIVVWNARWNYSKAMCNIKWVCGEWEMEEEEIKGYTTQLKYRYKF